MRILHLIDQPGTARDAQRPTDPDAALLQCGTLIRGLPQFEQSVCLIGGTWLEDRAAAAGIPAADRISQPLGITSKARAGLAAYLRDRGEPDVIHCWSGRAAEIARSIADAPVCLTPAGMGLGLPLGLDGGARPRTRRALGLRNDEVLVVLIGGEPGEADALRLNFVMSLLHVADGPAVWLVPSAAGRLARAQRFQWSSGWARLVTTDRPLVEQIAGADLGVWVGGPWSDAGPAGPSQEAAVLISAALGAGVPVVAPRWPTVEHLYPESIAPDCLAFNAATAELARHVLSLAIDPGARRRVREALLAAEPDLGRFAAAMADRWRVCSARRSTAYAGLP
jgi:hypothetical protein